MQRIFPLSGDRENDTHKFWDHLAIMSDFKLDIDYPFDVDMFSTSILAKPNAMQYTKNNIKVRHYGSLMSEIFDKLKEMPEGEERDRLVEITANHMKYYCLIEYSQGSVDDQKVADDLAYYTDGKIQLDLNRFRFCKHHLQPYSNGKEEKMLGNEFFHYRGKTSSKRRHYPSRSKE